MKISYLVKAIICVDVLEISWWDDKFRLGNRSRSKQCVAVPLTSTPPLSLHAVALVFFYFIFLYTITNISVTATMQNNRNLYITSRICNDMLLFVWLLMVKFEIDIILTNLGSYVGGRSLNDSFAWGEYNINT